MNVSLIMRNAADVLTVARRARLGGDVVRAQRLESKAERILGQFKAAGSDLADELLTAWEGSLESSPAFLEEWQDAYSLDDLLQLSVIDDEEYKRRLDAAHARGPVRGQYEEILNELSFLAQPEKKPRSVWGDVNFGGLDSFR